MAPSLFGFVCGLTIWQGIWVYHYLEVSIPLLPPVTYHGDTRRANEPYNDIMHFYLPSSQVNSIFALSKCKQQIIIKPYAVTPTFCSDTTTKPETNESFCFCIISVSPSQCRGSGNTKDSVCFIELQRIMITLLSLNGFSRTQWLYLLRRLQIELNHNKSKEMLVFCEREKPEYLRKNL